MANARSHSSISEVAASQKVSEALTFFRWSANGTYAEFDRLFDQLASYRSTYERLTGRPFETAHSLEIGYGSRPFRLIAMMSMGMDVRGVDLDMPLLSFSPLRILKIFKANGTDRALKTTVRGLLFDRRERAVLRRELARRGFDFRLDKSRFLVGDAATFDYGARKFDFIYSEDVFEHIPPQDLETLVAKLPILLSEDGVAIIRPNVFTGITGGHLPEWYQWELDRKGPKRSEPWDHLRKARYTPNTYLNRLGLAQYRGLFSRHLDIVEERADHPNLGRQWLTPELRQELAAWDDEELFSNQVKFVLRRKRN